MKKFTLYRFNVCAAALLLVLVHFPFASSISNGMGLGTVFNRSVYPNTNASNSTVSSLSAVYDNLHLNTLGLSKQAFDYAVKGYTYFKGQGKLLNQRVLSIVDFTQPSYKKRLFVVDLEKQELLFNTYVAHGQNTGEAQASHFSNVPESFQSSLGFYITDDTYIGKNGFSLQLNGMEKGINDNASERAIVMHGAPYVSEGFIRSRGYIGRSHGCPAVPEKLTRPIINNIKNGSCLFIYGKDRFYTSRSKILNT